MGRKSEQTDCNDSEVRQLLQGGGIVTIVLALVSVVVLVHPETASRAADKRPQADLDGYRKDVEPFLKQHCIKCHGPDRQKGKLALHTIDANVPSGQDTDKWKAVAERLTLGDMPPDSEPRPDAKAVTQVLAWIKVELAKGGESTTEAERKLLLPGNGNRVDHDALFAGKITAPAASPARLWRLSPQIYTALTPRIAGQRQRTAGNLVAQPFSGIVDPENWTTS